MFKSKHLILKDQGQIKSLSPVTKQLFSPDKTVLLLNPLVFVIFVLHRDLLKMFQEIHYWERLMFETPHYAVDVYNKREDLRGLREHVMLVVRDYNRSVLGHFKFVCITTLLYTTLLHLYHSLLLVLSNVTYILID